MKSQFAPGDLVRMSGLPFRNLRVFGPRADHWKTVPEFTGIVRKIVYHPSYRGDTCEQHRRTFVIVEDDLGHTYNCRDYALVAVD